MSLVGAIEAGGTKFVCAVGDGQTGSVVAATSIATVEHAATTLTEAAAWLSGQQREHGRLQAIGIASFGPIELHLDSPTYGHITSTPKPGWRNTDFVGSIKKSFDGI